MSKAICRYPQHERLTVIRRRLKECRATQVNQSGLGFWAAVDAVRNRKFHKLEISDSEADSLLEVVK